jgi:hypothetical protein
MTSIALALSLTGSAALPMAAKAETEFRAKVDAARAGAIKYLKDRQGKDGTWEAPVLNVIEGQTGGQTALATLALLEAGVPATDPAVAKAVEYLLTLKPQRTCTVSLQTQALARADARKYAKEIRANADWLVEKAIYRDGKLTGWSYPGNQIADGSNTHFAVMGLHAAAQAGAEVDAKIWAQLRAKYTDTQTANKGWAYADYGQFPASHSMSLAGLLGLAVAAKNDPSAKGPGEAFDQGMGALLGGKLGEFGDGKSWYYSWFTAAELGRVLGGDSFKAGTRTRAWYRDGADKIVKRQQADGSLASPKFEIRRCIDTDWPVVTTAFGLYVLGPPKK